ncbi:hypothetical protein IW140_000030 [Coemansia sp. RSA 1813]|nr:hypothetical protein EV178_000168 [Coemansia sp. RSA 1646]KAJ1771363.1 hypothetical protein LPJ74_002403 [Coemansia sp. RSA 1843]KAJ2093136.1 hypothetical protein IW138_000428 [Coemansia sp. RSA 986]KAJ2217598.1 hypothetical protein EV179_000433 [Coemansia sp. RSA 487]KAJ2573389.1 hypothetical protein IW140_000030 [Coemansia sp. RSA 1813]
MSQESNNDNTNERVDRENAAQERLESHNSNASQESSARQTSQQVAGEPEHPRSQIRTGVLRSEGLETHSQAGLYADVGASDLNPPGPEINSRPGYAGRGDAGGSMLVGPTHPMFGQGIDDDDDDYAGIGPLGGPERLPPDAMPPGARFDPVTPFRPMPGGPGYMPGRGRGGRGRGGRGRGAGGPFGGDPDNDAFMPPGGSGFGSGGPDSFL